MTKKYEIGLGQSPKPLFLETIADIPIIGCSNHNDSIHSWQQFRLATLLHVDGHHDMKGDVELKKDKEYIYS